MNQSTVLAMIFAAVSASAQWLNYPTAGVPRLRDGRPDLAANAPKLADGKPDFSGLWEPSREGGTPSSFGADLVLPAEFLDIGARVKGGLPFRQSAIDLKAARQKNVHKESPDGNCLPLSPLWLHSNLFPRKIVHAPGLMVILYEKNMEYRQIFTDGRPLPNDPQPSWMGYSSGKWDGDTLVVQTNGFRDDTWADSGGTPISDAAKVTERFRRRNYGNLEIEITVDDPKLYTAPWTVSITQHIKLDTELLEYVCLENDRSRDHMVGK